MMNITFPRMNDVTSFQSHWSHLGTTSITMGTSATRHYLISTEVSDGQLRNHKKGHGQTQPQSLSMANLALSQI